jgi:hypothetical protein
MLRHDDVAHHDETVASAAPSNGRDGKSFRYGLHRSPPLQKKQRWGSLGENYAGKGGPAPPRNFLSVIG